MNMSKTRRGAIRAYFEDAVLAAAAAAVVAATPFTAVADSISVDNVVQRWPWNNKLDITYTVNGGQNVAAGVYARIVFTANIGGRSFTIDGVHDVGANASGGTHTVTWTLPPGLRANDCTMTAQLLSADNPSGDDYMIIDLDSGEIMYEGLLASQEASNARYNTDLYKSTNIANRCCMVLRKVSAGGPYPTGDSAHSSSWVYGKNTSKMWMTDRDYYIGVFPVTQYQYKKIHGDNPSQNTLSIAGNDPMQRPVEQVSWNALRGSIASTSAIPVTATASGNFFQRLNFLTGNKFGFDLPTEVMFEIALRAGATTTYYWGDSDENATDYIVCKENSEYESGKWITKAVGSLLPNNWGLYDVSGNVWERCRDDDSLENLAAAADPFTPAWNNSAKRRVRGGCPYNNIGKTSTNPAAVAPMASYRFRQDSSDSSSAMGFRVAWIVD